ncbi:hypothetical protein AVEN_249500-1, partial [Araneus ventricosus]
FSAAVSTSQLKRTLLQINVWNRDWVPNLGTMGVALDFPTELLQQFLSFASIMGTVMQEDNTITQHARAFASDGFTMAHDYLLFPKLKDHLSGTKFSSNSDVNESESCRVLAQ